MIRVWDTKCDTMLWKLHGGAYGGGTHWSLTQRIKRPALLSTVSILEKRGTKISLIQDGKDAEFWPESMSPFYTLPTGARSCYNHVVMAGLQVRKKIVPLGLFLWPLNIKQSVYLLGWLSCWYALQAFVEAGGEADLDIYRAVLRFPIYRNIYDISTFPIAML